MLCLITFKTHEGAAAPVPSERVVVFLGGGFEPALHRGDVPHGESVSNSITQLNILQTCIRSNPKNAIKYLIY